MATTVKANLANGTVVNSATSSSGIPKASTSVASPLPVAAPVPITCPQDGYATMADAALLAKLANSSFVGMLANNVTVLPAGCSADGATFSNATGCSSSTAVGTTYILAYTVALPSCNQMATVNVRTRSSPPPPCFAEQFLDKP